MAQEMSEFTKLNILQQAGTSMLGSGKSVAANGTSTITEIQE